MAQSQNTVREIFVATAKASETTLKAFEADASDGEIGVFLADGSAPDAVGDFVVAAKVAGSTIVSDKYSPEDIKRLKAVAGSPQVLREFTVTPTETTAGTEYVLEVRLLEFGSLSANDFLPKFGHYVVKTGDDASDIADGLKASLDKQFQDLPGATSISNPAFTFASAAGVLTITEKVQELELGKKEGRPLSFNVRLDLVDGESIGDVEQVEGGSPGKATGRQVALMEYFFRGNRGDAFRDLGFPYTWSKATKTTADPSVQYSLIELDAIKKHSDTLNVSSSSKGATIAVPDGAENSEYTVINSIIDDLEAVSGVTITPALVNSTP